MKSTTSNLTCATRVTVLKDIDLQPHCIVRAGARGTLTHVAEDFVELLLDDHYDGLTEWDNKAWLVPDNDDVASYLKRIRTWRWPAHAVQSIAAGVALFALGAGLAEAVGAAEHIGMFWHGGF